MSKFQIFMKYGKITGSQKGKYHGWIEITSYTFARSNPKSEVDTLYFTKYFNEDTNKLLLEAFRRVPSIATIDVIHEKDNFPFVKIKLEKTQLDSVSMGSPKQPGQMIDEDKCSLTFGKVSISYHESPKSDKAAAHKLKSFIH